MSGFNITGGNSRDPNSNAEFHRSHRWTVESLGIPALAYGGTVSRDAPLRLYAQSIQLPSLTFEEEKIKSGSAIEYKIAKKAAWQDFTIKFYDVFGLYKQFENWQKLIWNQEDGIGRADRYKGSVILELKDGFGVQKQLYTAFGAYPKSVTHGELSYTSSDIKLLTVAYSYDYAKVEFFD